MDRSTTYRIVRVCVLIAVACLYFYACHLPGGTTLDENGQPSVGEWSFRSNGFGLLLVGWVTAWAPESLLFPSWLSNFICLTGAIFLGYGRSSVAFVVSGVGLAFASLALVPQREFAFLDGCNWWLGSFAFLTVGSAVVALIEWRESRRNAGRVRQAVRLLADYPGVSVLRRQSSDGIEPATRQRIEAE